MKDTQTHNADLISRSALLAVPNVCKVTEFDEAGFGMSYLAVPLAAINNAPTIDAVEVVRCKDCEEYIPWSDGHICGVVGSYFGNTKPNDFCSRGKRKMNTEAEG